MDTKPSGADGPSVEKASERIKQWQTDYIKSQLPDTGVKWYGNTMVVSPIFRTSDMTIGEGSTHVIQCTTCGLIRLMTEKGCERCNRIK